MPQSLCQIYVHLVFSTKERRQWIDEHIREEVHAYLAGTLRQLHCADVHVGGPVDHVHALFLLPKSAPPSKLVQEIKQNASRYVKTLRKTLAAFAWQRGYALFSVSPTTRDAVTAYISHQVEHHQRMSFQDELRKLLTKAGLQYDEQYLWD